MELDNSDSLVIGATNHAGLLDRALFRRFDTIIEYGLPTGEIAERVMKARLALLDTKQIDWEKATAASHDLSHAELSKACEHAAKLRLWIIRPS